MPSPSGNNHAICGVDKVQNRASYLAYDVPNAKLASRLELAVVAVRDVHVNLDFMSMRKPLHLT